MSNNSEITVGFKTSKDYAKKIDRGVDALKKEIGLTSVNQSDFFRKAVDELLARLKVK